MAHIQLVAEYRLLSQNTLIVNLTASNTSTTSEVEIKAIPGR